MTKGVAQIASERLSGRESAGGYIIRVAGLELLRLSEGFSLSDNLQARIFRRVYANDVTSCACGAQT